jgi:hypothetical protein
MVWSVQSVSALPLPFDQSWDRMARMKVSTAGPDIETKEI